MKLSATREALLKPLQAVIGVVERRQTMPILANVLLVARNGQVSITATDLEVELVARALRSKSKRMGRSRFRDGRCLDICRALPEGAKVAVSVAGKNSHIRSGRSKFSLITLPAAEFPTIEDINAGQSIELEQATLAKLLDKTHFSMAQQDVRYYLNGLLIETMAKAICAAWQRMVTGWRCAKVELKGLQGPGTQNRSLCQERVCWNCSAC